MSYWTCCNFSNNFALVVFAVGLVLQLALVTTSPSLPYLLELGSIWWLPGPGFGTSGNILGHWWSIRTGAWRVASPASAASFRISQIRACPELRTAKLIGASETMARVAWNKQIGATRKKMHRVNIAPGAGFMKPCALLKLDFLTSACNKCIH